MKTKTDPRHLKRQQIIKELFEWDSHNKIKNEEIRNKKGYDLKTKQIIDLFPRIDKIIELHATKWPKEKINQIDIAILRLAIFELQFDKTVPVKVVIDEAVELAKEFGGDASPDFVNGVLGAVIKNDH